LSRRSKKSSDGQELYGKNNTITHKQDPELYALDFVMSEQSKHMVIINAIMGLKGGKAEAQIAVCKGAYL
jgi:hypothetical protein